MRGSGKPIIHVAAGVLADAAGRVLLCDRPAGRPLAGFWEFPGGKLEAGESPLAALERELAEELGVHPSQSRPLIHLVHDYPDKRVVLHVRRVDAWQGEPQALEGQRLAWVYPRDMAALKLLPANRPIVSALCLPDTYAITPAPQPENHAGFLAQLEMTLETGISLLQFRAPGLAVSEYAGLAETVIETAHRRNCRVVLNADPGLVRELGADGVHLSAKARAACRQRPLPESLLVGVSCHNGNEIAGAREIRADFAVLGPVRATPSHPGRPGLGWTGFSRLAAGAGLPVYALGGLNRADLPSAWEAGAQGIAAIRGLWPSDTVRQADPGD